MSAMDETAFTAGLERHRRELRAHCYRMLGSAPEAEDATQDALLKAWQARASLDAITSLRPWLYRIATNVCLDLLQRRGPRVLPDGAFPPAEPGAAPRPFLESSIWVGPWVETAAGADELHERAEHLRLAFVAALQHLPGKQRAVLLLRDVVELSAKEAAEVLETTPGAVEAALQRARTTLATRTDELRVDEAPAALLGRYVEAWQSGDAVAFVALLRDDASFVMPPTPVWYQGKEAVGSFVAARYRDARWHLVPLRVNARPGFALYRSVEGGWVLHGIQVLDVAQGAIARIHTFLSMGEDRNAKVFGLAPRLEGDFSPRTV